MTEMIHHRKSDVPSLYIHQLARVQHRNNWYYFKSGDFAQRFILYVNYDVFEEREWPSAHIRPLVKTKSRVENNIIVYVIKYKKRVI